LCWVVHVVGFEGFLLFVMGFFEGGGGGGVSVMCAILGCAAQVCLLAAVLCTTTILSDENLMTVTLGRNM